MDRQKKTLQHHMTGRECGRDSEGWLGSHEWQLKFQRGSSVGEGFPLRSVGSKPQSGLPSLQHQSQKGTQKHPAVKSSRGSVSQGEMAGDAESLLRAKAQNFVGRHLPWVLAEAGLSGLETLEESLGLVALGRQLKEQLPGSLC